MGLGMLVDDHPGTTGATRGSSQVRDDDDVGVGASPDVVGMEKIWDVWAPLSNTAELELAGPGRGTEAREKRAYEPSGRSKVDWGATAGWMLCCWCALKLAVGGSTCGAELDPAGRDAVKSASVGSGPKFSWGVMGRVIAGLLLDCGGEWKWVVVRRGTREVVPGLLVLPR